MKRRCLVLCDVEIWESRKNLFEDNYITCYLAILNVQLIIMQQDLSRVRLTVFISKYSFYK